MKPSECLIRSKAAAEQGKSWRNIVDNLLRYQLRDKSAHVKDFNEIRVLIYYDITKASVLTYEQLDTLLNSKRLKAVEYLAQFNNYDLKEE